MNPLTRYRCHNCGELYAKVRDAEQCCYPEELYVCAACEREYVSYKDAEYCCSPAEKAEALETVGKQRLVE